MAECQLENDVELRSNDDDVRYLVSPFQRLQVGPNDVVVISYDSVLTRRAAQCMTSQIKKIFPNNEVLFLEGGFKIGAVNIVTDGANSDNGNGN